MLFRVDAECAVGLADQIAGQIRRGVAEGRLSPGDKLPAARELASGLDVNMHTVLRAYATLRDEGLLELRRGRGARIRSDVDPLTSQLDDEIRSLLASARRLGMSRDQLVGRIDGLHA